MSAFGFAILVMVLYGLYRLVKAVFTPDPEMDKFIQDNHDFTMWKMRNGMMGYMNPDRERKMRKIWESKRRM